LSLGTLGLEGGVMACGMEDSSSVSRRLASMSWSLDRFGPGGGGRKNQEHRGRRAAFELELKRKSKM